MLTKRSKTRKWHRFVFHIQNFDLPSKVIFIWAIITIISTSLPWFSLKSWLEDKYYSFSSNSAFIWYIILIFSAVILFFLISKDNKERVRYNLSLSLHDHAIIMFSWILLFFVTFSIFFMIKAFSEFSYSVTIYPWINLAFVGTILITTWGFLLYKKHKVAILNQIYIENKQKMSDIELEDYSEILSKENYKSDKKNMKLPI